MESKSAAKTKGGKLKKSKQSEREKPPEAAENFEHTIRRMVIEKERKRQEQDLG